MFSAIPSRDWPRAADSRGVSDMHRLLGVAASIAFHMSLMMLWWHQSNLAGLSSALAATGQEKGIEVQLIAMVSPVAAGAPPSIARKSLLDETQSARPPQQRNAIETPASVPQAPIFYGPQEVDKGALPFSAPDPDLLAGVAVSGVPIRVRLYIDASGVVTAIDKLQALDDDQQALERIETMLRHTSFMPARLAGADVNSYQDLEFHIGPEQNGASE
ncbi:hypothetical protein [Collimonas fungivorans]|uniref:hypothetical protein n=1 Tax=Collimonas fungivorans TaxID=158899 RepID=UPI0011D28856|nr:hypothetical protein [Collimonas fungivorans]